VRPRSFTSSSLLWLGGARGVVEKIEDLRGNASSPE
jgi:hypothetical protein